MNNENMANFICQLRKSKNLTQKQLAEKLNITDKAVSKWERGAGCPDITTLIPLAEILGVTVNELLNGRCEQALTDNSHTTLESTLSYAQVLCVEKDRQSRKVMEIILSSLFLLAIITCTICDLAISKELTWSLYPIISIIFSWLIIIPLFHFERNRVLFSLASLSIFIIPFLFGLEKINNGPLWVAPLGLPIAILSTIFLWIVYFIHMKTKLSRWHSWGICAIIAIPLTFIINIICSSFTSQPSFDTWDALSTSFLIAAAITFFSIGVKQAKSP